LRSFPVNNFLQNKQKIAALVRMLIINTACHVMSSLPFPLQLKPPKSAKKKPATAEAIAGKGVELEGFAITSSNLVNLQFPEVPDYLIIPNESGAGR
jgi:hypothetical protein